MSGRTDGSPVDAGQWTAEGGPDPVSTTLQLFSRGMDRPERAVEVVHEGDPGPGRQPRSGGIVGEQDVAFAQVADRSQCQPGRRHGPSAPPGTELRPRPHEDFVSPTAQSLDLELDHLLDAAAASGGVSDQANAHRSPFGQPALREHTNPGDTPPWTPGRRRPAAAARSAGMA